MKTGLQLASLALPVSHSVSILPASLACWAGAILATSVQSCNRQVYAAWLDMAHHVTECTPKPCRSARLQSAYQGPVLAWSGLCLAWFRLGPGLGLARLGFGQVLLLPLFLLLRNTVTNLETVYGSPASLYNAAIWTTHNIPLKTSFYYFRLTGLLLLVRN